MSGVGESWKKKKKKENNYINEKYTISIMPISYHFY